MESNVFIIGKISNTPQIIKNGEIMRIAFSVTDSETGAVVPVIAETSRNLLDRIRGGDTVEIEGTVFTKKITVSGKARCQRTVWAHSFSVMK